jgi:hypothetical protein
VHASRRTRPASTTWASCLVNILTGAVIAVCALSVYLNLTGIPLIPQENAWVPAESLPQLAQLELPSGSSRTEITVLPLWLRALGVLNTVLLAVMLVLVFRTVHLLAVRAAEGRPFADDVVRRLQRLPLWLGALIIARLAVDVVTIAALTRWFEAVLEDTRQGGGLGTNFPALSLTMIVAAAVAAVLASAFRRGRELTEDTDGLV